MLGDVQETGSTTPVLCLCKINTIPLSVGLILHLRLRLSVDDGDDQVLLRPSPQRFDLAEFSLLFACWRESQEHYTGQHETSVLVVSEYLPSTGEQRQGSFQIQKPCPEAERN